MCNELMKLCTHISNEHSEMFPKRDKMDRKCDVCYLQLESKDKVISHMKENHSPESFYSKIVEDISGECRICKDKVCSSEMEDHFQSVHTEIQMDNNKQYVRQLLLDIINISIIQSEEKQSNTNCKIHGGGKEKKQKEVELEKPDLVTYLEGEGKPGMLSDTDDDNDVSTEEESESQVNPVYEYNYSQKNERYVGCKPSFLQAVEELKNSFIKKENHAMVINGQDISVKDLRALKYGTAIDIEIKTAKQKGYAVLKIWGPSYSDKAKKKCTVMVSKI